MGPDLSPSPRHEYPRLLELTIFPSHAVNFFLHTHIVVSWNFRAILRPHFVLGSFSYDQSYRVKSLPLIYNVVNFFHCTLQFAITVQALPEPRSLPAHRAVVQTSQPFADLLLTDLAIPIHHLHHNRSTIPMGRAFLCQLF
jgi:hypothetical protein